MSGTFRSLFTVAMIAMFVSLAALSQAGAATLTWQVRSNHPNIVDLEFYAEDGKRAWPGDGQVYIMDDWNVHSFVLNCYPGEKICLGAWVRGDFSRYWGVGNNGQNRCASCCYICNGGTTTIQELNP